MSTEGKIIHCKAGVCWGLKEPVVYEDVEIDPPKKGEVRVKIIASGVCHSDLSGRDGIISALFPVILGHEGAGIVESVGEGVTSVKPGDHVITIYIPQCRDCRACNYPDRNKCDKCEVNTWSGKMADGTTRFRCKGKTVHNFLGISSFSQYTVVSQYDACKINPTAPLNRVCLLACGVGTGYGSAVKTAKVTPGSTCAVWGLGGIGLACVMGCRRAGAKKIIGIDINEDKAEKAKIFGLTDFVNPKNLTRPISEVLREMTDGGLDFTFECVGHKQIMKDAIAASHPGLGTTTIVGVAPGTHLVEINPLDLLYGRTVQGTLFGSLKPLDDVPVLVEEYLNKTLMLDEFVTETLPGSEVEKSFDIMKQGKVIRTVLDVAGN